MPTLKSHESCSRRSSITRQNVSKHARATCFSCSCSWAAALPTLWLCARAHIAMAYSCYWYHSKHSSKKYLKFIWKIKGLSERVITEYANSKNVDRETAKEVIREKASSNVPFTKSLLKIIDEHNYAFTKYWNPRR